MSQSRCFSGDEGRGLGLQGGWLAHGLCILSITVRARPVSRSGQETYRWCSSLHSQTLATEVYRNQIISLSQPRSKRHMKYTFGLPDQKTSSELTFFDFPFSIWGMCAVCTGPLQLPDTLLVNKTSIKQTICQTNHGGEWVAGTLERLQKVLESCNSASFSQWGSGETAASRHVCLANWSLCEGDYNNSLFHSYLSRW